MTPFTSNTLHKKATPALPDGVRRWADDSDVHLRLHRTPKLCVVEFEADESQIGDYWRQSNGHPWRLLYGGESAAEAIPKAEHDDLFQFLLQHKITRGGVCDCIGQHPDNQTRLQVAERLKGWLRGRKNKHKKPAAKTAHNSGTFLFTRSGQPAGMLEGHFRDQSVFLLCGGPSLAELDLRPLNQRGIMTAAINQVAGVNFRPQLWFTVDQPNHFLASIWRDPAIWKFTRRCNANGTLRIKENGVWTDTKQQAKHCPNTWFYEHSFGFAPETFLTMPVPTWGRTYEIKQNQMRETKSSMLPALRLLYWLGFRTVFLLGADFHYRPEKTYAFAANKDASACGYNNNSMNILNQWFHELRPHFDGRGFHVLNATVDSRLDAFDVIDYQDAVRAARAGIPTNLDVSDHYQA